MAWRATAEQIKTLNKIRASESDFNKRWKSRDPIQDSNVLFFEGAATKDLIPPPKIIMEPDVAKRELTAIISSVSPDESGDVVFPMGGDYERFRKSPTVLYCHDRYGMTDMGLFNFVGKALYMTPTMREIYARVKFAKGIIQDQLFELCLEGVVKMWSIGFNPTEEGPPTMDDVKLYPDLDWSRVARVIRKWRLLEFSLTPLGCNPDAFTQMVKSQRFHSLDPFVRKSLVEHNKAAIPETIYTDAWEGSEKETATIPKATKEIAAAEVVTKAEPVAAESTATVEPPPAKVETVTIEPPPAQIALDKPPAIVATIKPVAAVRIDGMTATEADRMVDAIVGRLTSESAVITSLQKTLERIEHWECQITGRID